MIDWWTVYFFIMYNGFCSLLFFAEKCFQSLKVSYFHSYWLWLWTAYVELTMFIAFSVGFFSVWSEIASCLKGGQTLQFVGDSGLRMNIRKIIVLRFEWSHCLVKLTLPHKCLVLSFVSVFRLFPPDLFEKFIDVGHYVRDLNAYRDLVDKISTLTVIPWAICFA